MVAIAGNQKGLELSDLYKLLCKNLPVYARPIFVRLLQNIETTGKSPIYFVKSTLIINFTLLKNTCFNKVINIISYCQIYLSI